MAQMSTVLQKLEEFLSTEMRRELFLYYVFSKTSPSDLSERTGIPISTVDMVTNTLRLMELVKEVEGKEKNKNYYEANIELWFEENLKELGMDFVGEEQKKEMLGIISDRRFLALSFLLADPDFAVRLYKEPLKMGDGFVIFKLVKLFEEASLVAKLLSYILLCVLAFPSFKEFKDNIFSEDVSRTIKLIETEAAKRPFLADVLTDVDAAALKEYDKKRVALAGAMERLLEQKLQMMSSEKVKEAVESETKEEESTSASEKAVKSEETETEQE